MQKQHSYFKGVEKIVFKCKDGKPANVNILDCVDGKLYKGKKNRKNGIVFPANTLITCGKMTLLSKISVFQVPKRNQKKQEMSATKTMHSTAISNART